MDSIIASHPALRTDCWSSGGIYETVRPWHARPYTDDLLVASIDAAETQEELDQLLGAQDVYPTPDLA